MPKDINVVETSNANKVFDIPVHLEPGQVNTLSFPQDSISEMRSLPQGELEIVFRDGSKVVVENFDELVNSAQSCGRDTIIQLSDNTIIYPEELAAQLDKGPVNFASNDANGIISLDAPKAGQVTEKNIESGHEYKLNFAFADTLSAAQAGQNLVLTFKDGGVLILKNYYTAMGSELPPAMTLADGSVIDSNALLTSCKLVEIPAIANSLAAAEPAAGEAAQSEVASAARKAGADAPPDVEPAAGGDPSKAAKAAESVANIEPAAGDAGNQPGSSSRGYGFGSSIDGAALNGVNPIGPIGATQLGYGANFPQSQLNPGVEQDVDSIPTILGATNNVDETNLGPNVVTGNAGADFKVDGPGTVTLNTTFVAGGSLAGGALTSNGAPVVISLVGNTYTGTANGVTVFTLVVDAATGDYTFTQTGPLDHANASDPNDLITLQFGVTATDADGDVGIGIIEIGVYDDGPVALDDGASVGSGPFTVTGNVTSNDDVGADVQGNVTQVVFNGTTYIVPAAGTISIIATYGTLQIDHTGAYTYTSSNTAEGTDQFTYTLVDFDGDSDTAVLSVEVTDIDTIPTISPSIAQVDETNLSPTSVNGTVTADFHDDGPGTFSLTTVTPGGSLFNGNLASNGNLVTTSLAGNTYTGTANGVTVFTLTIDPATGAYTYTQFGPLDHANQFDPNDVITLQFGVAATDADGDVTPTTITISVLDDGPAATNDLAAIAPGSTSVSGNVLTNDDAGNDGRPHVVQVTFNGTSYAVPTVGTVSVTGAYGTLVIGADGAYTYTSSNTAEGTDQFTYVMHDFDHDSATATLNLTVEDINSVPTVKPSYGTVDETNLAPTTSVSGSVGANFGDDGPGTFNLFKFDTSTALTSAGQPVSISLSGNTYTGTANGVAVFTLVLDPATGAYTFTQLGQLDHPDASNPNDAITLVFGVNASDTDGDTTPTTITITVLDDGPVAVNDTATVDPATLSVSGNVTGNDNVGHDQPGYVVMSISSTSGDYAVPATGTITINGLYGQLVIGANGAFTYTSFNTAEGTDHFTYQIMDQDGDTAMANLDVTIADIDTCPTIENAYNKVDETNLDDSGTQTVNGTLVVDYKDDGVGSVSASGSSSWSNSSPSKVLTSQGSQVTISLTGNVYTGTSADGRTIFTMQVNADGTYTFKQFDQLDHANPNNPDDIITLNFGVLATDTDGDTASAQIQINVYDDGPVAVDDVNSLASAPGSVSGNVLTNDDAGADEAGIVKSVSFNGTTVAVPVTGNVVIVGAHGTLTINSSGAYTYSGTSVGSDQFTYVIKDYDGDTASAHLTITVNDIDTCPTIENAFNKVDETNLDDSGTQTVNGTLVVDYKADGPGTVSASGSSSWSNSSPSKVLTSNGFEVKITLVGNVYTGTSSDGRTIFTMEVRADGTYTFKEFDQLDHANPNNPDDIITLNFGVLATDTDGDAAAATITIAVYDDGPVAVDDVNTVGNAPGSVSGNVLTNDDAGADEAGTVKSVSFNGTTVAVPITGNVVIVGAHGTLTINSSGAYTYSGTSVGADQFTYVIKDYDGDTASAHLTITVNDIDTCPTIENVCLSVDETNLDNAGTQVLNGTLNVNYLADGPGTVTANGATFWSNSAPSKVLTSNGFEVKIALVGNVYTGTSTDGRTIFTLEVRADGTYTFKEFDQLDHANPNNPDDVITLAFGVTATDSDGDTASATISIAVHDDGPVAVDDVNTVGNAPGSASGNVLTNDDAGADEAGSVKSVSFNGTTVAVPVTGNVVIVGAHGTLTINSTGAYTYQATSAGVDQFTYQIKDYDGDTANAHLTITVNDIDTCPTIENVCLSVDETNLDNLGTQTLNGTLVVDYKADGPGTVSANGATFWSNSSPSKVLTSNGFEVKITLVGNTYTGTSTDGRTIFTLEVRADGAYTFKEFDQLDHANPNNPDDVITLAFGVTATDADGDTAAATISIAVHDDGPIAVNDVNTVTNAPATVTGNVLANDDAGADEAGIVKSITFGTTTVNLPASGNVIITSAHGTLTINSTGAYSYTGTSTGVDQFTYQMADYDGDKASACLTITVTDIDTCPTIENAINKVDETNLDNSGTQTVNGTLVVDYKADGPGSVSGTGNSGWTNGTVSGTQLTSHGSVVTIAFAGNVYTGTSADGRTIFTMEVRADGTYTFKEFDQLDHADPANPDDIITLTFGVVATDTDGDTAVGKIQIKVYDDGPVAVDDANAVGSAPGSVSGNVLTNDDAGADEAGTVKSVSFNGTVVTVPASGNVVVVGAHGTLTINSSGAYTYSGTSVGSDQFTYVIKDYDGDTASAHLTITVNDIDTCPTIENAFNKVDETNLDDSGTQTVTGTLVVDYKADGPGTVTGNGNSGWTNGTVSGTQLTSHGSVVTIAFAGNVYTGTSADGRTIFTMEVKADGTYTFKLIDQLDHADPTNPDDIITLTFGVLATDTDGDAATAKIEIKVYDDGPVAVDDVNTVGSAPGSVSGNVLTNDDAGADEAGTVKSVSFNGTVVTVPASGNVVIAGAHGTLTINSTGAYTYQATSTGADQFTYVIKDYDGDTANAHLTITVNDIDTCPTIENVCLTVDETNLDNAGTQTLNGTLNVNYLADGPGAVTPSGASTFNATGSFTGGLTSHGSAVTVTLVGNTYTGTSADGRTVFTLLVKTDGTYTFQLVDQLDHANPNNPDDIINLNFGVTATDTDGDAATATISVAVHDDGPIAVDDVNTVTNAPASVTGNVLTNDDAGADEPGIVKSVTFGTTTVTVPASGNVVIVGAHGSLTINSSGTYTYTGSSVGSDQFTYQMADYDGDKASAKLTITVNGVDEQPCIGDVVKTIDETNLGPNVVSGTIPAEFYSNGPGALTLTGFSASGYIKNGQLASCGDNITVSLQNGVYVGIDADGATVFTLSLNSSTGAYTFTQFKGLDHANPNDPNEIITLKFTVTGTDADGDTDTGTITINIHDDAPIAHDDNNSFVIGTTGHDSGNVLTGLNGGPGAADTLSKDGGNHVTLITFKGTEYSVPANGTLTVNGDHGVLNIKADGSYTYDLYHVGSTEQLPNFHETLGFPVVGEGSPTFNEASPNEGVNPLALDIGTSAHGQVKVISETAGFSNTLGLYTVGADGTIHSVQVVSANVNDLALGGVTNFEIPPNGQGVGFFLIGNGFTFNNGYAGVDLSEGNLAFYYHYGQADQRLAKVTDNGFDITLVALEPTPVVINGPVYHTTDRDGSTAINPDGMVHTISGLADPNDPTVLRIGFEDLPAQGDRDFSDVVFDFTYTPAPPQETFDQFCYVVTDCDGDSSIAALNLTGTLGMYPVVQPVIVNVDVNVDVQTNVTVTSEVAITNTMTLASISTVTDATTAKAAAAIDVVADDQTHLVIDPVKLPPMTTEPVSPVDEGGTVEQHLPLDPGFTVYYDPETGTVVCGVPPEPQPEEPPIVCYIPPGTVHEYPPEVADPSPQPIKTPVGIIDTGMPAPETSVAAPPDYPYQEAPVDPSTYPMDPAAETQLTYGGSSDDVLLMLQDVKAITISDFDPGEGDILDFSALVLDFDPVSDAINDFVYARSEGNNTVISVDPDGQGAASQAIDIVILKDVSVSHVEDVVQIAHQQQNQSGTGTI